MSEQSTKISRPTDYRKSAIIGIRCLQLLCVAATITGILWATSDWLLAIALAQAPVTPLSVLLMLYGTMGIFLNEVAVRLLRRQYKTANFRQ